jgi:hypothetical protein
MNAPVSRRAALTGALATIPALAGAAAAASPSLAFPANPDAEILALSARICAERERAEALREARVEPFEDEFYATIEGGPFGMHSEASVEAAFAFSHRCGREAAVKEMTSILEGADDMFNKMMAIPAMSQPGRAAKVRALLLHVMSPEWRGDSEDRDWDCEMARTLLGEFAGMGEKEMAEI